MNFKVAMARCQPPPRPWPSSRTSRPNLNSEASNTCSSFAVDSSACPVPRSPVSSAHPLTRAAASPKDQRIAIRRIVLPPVQPHCEGHATLHHAQRKRTACRTVLEVAAVARRQRCEVARHVDGSWPRIPARQARLRSSARLRPFSVGSDAALTTRVAGEHGGAFSPPLSRGESPRSRRRPARDARRARLCGRSRFRRRGGGDDGPQDAPEHAGDGIPLTMAKRTRYGPAPDERELDLRSCRVDRRSARSEEPQPGPSTETERRRRLGIAGARPLDRAPRRCKGQWLSPALREHRSSRRFAPAQTRCRRGPRYRASRSGRED